jgi:hypothetical protein
MSDSRGLTEAAETVSVVVLDDSGDINNDPAVEITSPNGGENIFKNTTSILTWNPLTGGNVSIDLLKEGVLHSSITDTTENDGLFEWHVPLSIRDGSDYQIRITSLSNGFKDEGDGFFSIVSQLLDDTALNWSMTGGADWFAQDDTTQDGTDAAQSGDIGNNQESSIETTLPSPGILTFYWKVSSQANHDYLELYINDVLQTGPLARISGEVGWVQHSVRILSPDTTIRWTYRKDGSISRGSDAGWLDQVFFTPVEDAIVTPNGGETFYAADSNSIIWFSDVGGNVSIDLLKGGNRHSVVTSSTINDGRYEWAVPHDTPDGTDYRIRINFLDTDAPALESAADFAITPDALAGAVDLPEYSWSSTGTAEWFLQSATTHDGVDAAQGGAVGHDQSTSIQTTLPVPGTLTFYWKVSSEQGYDFLEFYINDERQTGSLKKISGEVDWVQKTVDIPSPQTTVRWTYEKDGTVSKGSDTGWLDQVTFTPSEQGVLTPNGRETFYLANTGNIYWFYDSGRDVSIELLKGGAFHSDIASSTANDGQFEWTVPADLPEGTDYQIRIRVLDNVALTDTSDDAFTITLFPIGTAVDTTELIWQSTGDENWFIQSTTTHDGVDAAQGGAIGHNQSTSIQTTLPAPGTLTFYWKVSSEPRYDFLEFYINDELQTGSLERISGDVDWVQKTVDIPSPHTTVRWTYDKDLSVSNGSDTGWVDQIVFTPELSAFETWAGHGASPDADTNSDGVSDLIAWVLGADTPSEDATVLLPVSDNSSDPNHWIFTFRRSDTAHTDPATNIYVEHCHNLSNWDPIIHNGASIVITETDDFYGPGVDRVEVFIHRELMNEEAFFIRLRAETAP